MKKMKKKKKKRIKKRKPILLYQVEVAPYKEVLFWSWAPTATQFLRELKRSLPNLTPQQIPPKVYGSCEIFWDGKAHYPVIWVSDPSKPWLLAHELEHYVHWLLDEKGLKFTDDSEEAYAYLIEFLMELMINSRRPNRYP